MAEVLAVFSVVPAATQLAEQSLRALGRLRKAYIREKALVEVLRRHECEVGSVKSIIRIIDDEEDLHTATVASELTRLKEVQRKLAKLLEDLVPKSKGKLNRLAHQLAQGSSDEKKLTTIMDELGHAKSSLLLRIQVANVGLMRDMEKRLVANAEVIERIDLSLKEELGDCEGLRIARLLRGRRPSNDGTVPLTPADLMSLTREESDDDSSDETLVDDSESNSDCVHRDQARTERIILRNTTRDQGLQINAALGKDMWEKVDRLEIKDNVTEGDSTQINYAMTCEALKFAMNCQTEKMLATRQGLPKVSRRDSGVDA